MSGEWIGAARAGSCLCKTGPLALMRKKLKSTAVKRKKRVAIRKIFRVCVRVELSNPFGEFFLVS